MFYNSILIIQKVIKSNNLAQHWLTEAIERRLNPLTGRLDGDDHGYREVMTLTDNYEDLVEPQVLMRPAYDGWDEYGHYDSARKLVGGLAGAPLRVRETVARGLEAAQQVLTQLFDNHYRLAVLDGFRSGPRQADGFKRTFFSLSESPLPDRLDPETLIALGRKAEGTFAWVPARENSPEYQELTRELLASMDFCERLEHVSRQTQRSQAALLSDYVTILCNTGLNGVSERRIPLHYENNAHASGGAVDVMLVDYKGKPLSLVPFDWVGPEAAIDYTEDDANHERYCLKAAQDPRLKEHLGQLGYRQIPNFNFAAWESIRAANRVRYRLMTLLGGTYYSAADPEHGGENWHFQIGNVIFGIQGEVLYEAPHARHYPHSGNACHAYQRGGPEAVAVWGASSAHAVAHRRYGLC